MGNYYLLTTVYNKVATLVVAAVFTIFYAFVLVEIFKLTEIRAEHHRYFSEVNSFFFLLENYILDLAFALASLGAVVKVVFKLFLAKLDIRIDLSAVSQVSHTGLVRKDGHHSFVGLKDSWCCVDVHLSKLDLIDHTL